MQMCMSLTKSQADPSLRGAGDEAYYWAMASTTVASSGPGDEASTTATGAMAGPGVYGWK